MPISKTLYEALRKRAQFRCEYCHYPEILSAAPLTVDHIIPQSLDGPDTFDNLALACRRCNERRYNFKTGTDPETGIETPIFNPRCHGWKEHFIWSADGTKVMGTSPMGRATCWRLDLNDERSSSQFIQLSRRCWVQSGLHPPDDDPQEI